MRREKRYTSGKRSAAPADRPEKTEKTEKMRKAEEAEKLLRTLGGIREDYILEAAVYGNQEREENRRSHPRGIRLRWLRYRALAGAAACAAMAFLAYQAVQSGNRTGKSAEQEQQAGLQVYQDVRTLEEAEKMAGFTIAAPPSRPPYDQVFYGVIDNAVIEVFYSNGKAQEEGYSLRKGRETKDVTGGYPPEGKRTVEIRETAAGQKVTLYGDSGHVTLAVWMKDGFAYAIRAVGREMSAEEMLALAGETDE